MRYPASTAASIRVICGCLLLALGSNWLAPASVFAQEERQEPAVESAAADAPVAPLTVDVEPVAKDSEIERRLLNILRATTWFETPEVDVNEGVVFLQGRTLKPEHRTWAGDLARNTQDVVAVVNQIEVVERSMWDLTPAWTELDKLGRETVQMLPLLAVALLVLALTWIAARASIGVARRVLGRRIQSHLLVNVIARGFAVPVFLLGLYLALRVSGLTQMAATVLGGTGLIGLILGIAFRDIAENFLASVLLSVQRPFALGDLIEVEGRMGIVQSVTTRGTLLMTLEGNHVQIPNSSIYKSVIRNVSSNPNVRCDFVMKIDYSDAVSEAQDAILEVIQKHEAVLETPAPMVLVEELGDTTITVRAYFWVNDHVQSAMKVKSSVMRLSRVAVQHAGLKMPRATYELLFPQGLPLRRFDGEREASSTPGDPLDSVRPMAAPSADDQVSTAAEVGFKSDRADLEEQARNARTPEQGANLLAPD